MSNQIKPEFKIQLGHHTQYLHAFDLLIQMGYECQDKPDTCQFLYAYSDGRVGVDYFDVEGADTSSPNSALGYFQVHKNKEITLSELEFLALHKRVWDKAPERAFVWERFPNGKCVWHCRDSSNQSYDKKAPNFPESVRNSLWRDLEKQAESDRVKAGIDDELKKRNIILI